jgi:hypothetical protein
VFGDGSRFEFKVFDATGSLKRVVRSATPTRSVSKADMTAWIAAKSEGRTPEARAATTAALGNVVPPRTVPAYRRLLTDYKNAVWVQTFEIDERKPQTWVVFDSSGALLGRVIVPGSINVLAVSDDVLVGLRKDADDVEQVVVYDIRRP